ncbi:FMN-dependent oxidoreductase (nitrilotriacetate monooxygenase family) [Microbacterium ginsengiterrae]|uniref:FMN-dependent oxidoreductase (Nitrilotriacetate monooxygenase family) n=1 Tax=Microbacterium ginsengiterrae TaxID=546115 RepID=A0A7W9CCY5_9MICO|nr:LLM class flavin-dependent oxidoreductase [Microbacterium ginsengiterrae]MBB5742997.1 FMN-dependent oxidoreductase (nitrilotriacetate monooxygenase family) [Microbacterium ginsengiterrae]
MTDRKQLILNLFEMNCVSHITHGLWRLPGNNRTRFNEIGYWQELAERAEDGGFDAIFLADVVGAYDTYRDGLETSLAEAVQIPSNDPLLVVPVMAAASRRLGFGVTFSTTYEPPFSFARRMGTLDHLTAGRVGWNIVTSYLPNAARNFGLADQIEHDQRYRIADEYLDVLYKLWEGSWDDGAVVADRERGVYARPEGVRYIDHRGEHFQVAGPHLVEPSRQRTPVLFQATGSPAGTAFAGRHAEAVFTGGRDVAEFRRNKRNIQDALVRNGRLPNDAKFLVQAGVVVGRTDEEAAEKLELYRRYSSVEGILAHSSLPFDPLAHAPETPLSEVLTRAGLDPTSGPWAAGADGTVGQFLDRITAGREGRFFVAGSPTTVADEIERWLDEDGIDGINLRQYHTFGTLTDFAELVVPELRRRGRLPSADEVRDDRRTLRERLLGEGPRLPDRHPGAQYRGGRNLVSETVGVASA